MAEQYEKREQAARVFSYINALEEPHRSLMTLRLVNELSFREIGTVLQRTENWAHMTFMQDKCRLIRYLEEAENGWPETSAVIEEHLETCNECRRLYEDYRKTVEVAKLEEVKANKRVLHRIWFQSLWYMFWPCFYAAALKGGWENGALIFLAIFSGLLMVALFQFPAYDMYFDDEKKGEYYKKEAGYLKRGEGNWLVRNLT